MMPGSKDQDFIGMEEMKMRKFLNSEVFVLVWGAAVVLYWPAGVVLSIIGLAAEALGKKDSHERMA